MTATETAPDLPPRLLVIDLENSVGTVRPRQRQLRAKIAALLAAAAPVHHAVAGYASDTDEDPLASLLAELGVAPLRTAPGPDAAEQILLAHARRVHDSLGCRHFVVASGDKRFSELATLGRLELLVWEDQPVAAKLTDVAHEVRRLARPTSGTDTGPADQGPEEPESDEDSVAVSVPQETDSLDEHPHWPFGRVMPRAMRATALHNYVLAYFNRHPKPTLSLWPALMTPTSVRTVVGPAGDAWMNPHDFLAFAGERGVQVVYGGFLDDGPDDEPVPFEQGLVLQYIQHGGLVHCWSAVNLDATAWASAGAHWRHRKAAAAATDDEMDRLVRGAGCVAISTSCLDWALGYLTHAMRGWDDATLNTAMGRPGYVWQEFSRLVDELHPLLGEDLVELRETVHRLREERHQLVHAVWMRTPGVPGVPDSYEVWNPRTDTTRPVTAEGLMELAQLLGQAGVEVQALTTALLHRAQQAQQP